MSDDQRQHTDKFVECNAQDTTQSYVQQLDTGDLMALAALYLERQYIDGYKSGKDYYSFNTAYDELES